MKEMVKLSIVVCYLLIVVCTELSMAYRIGLPHQNGQSVENTDLDFGQRVPDLPQILKKRTCNGFPCMYSHLGTKAGRASLYKTLAGFIDDCFSDPSCDPGRRKRNGPVRKLDELLRMPVPELHKRSLQEQFLKETY